MLCSTRPIVRSTLTWTLMSSRMSSSSSRLPLIPLWINGQSINQSSGGTVVCKHSKSGKEVSEVVVAGRDETDQAIKASWKAFETWRDTTGWERRAILSKALALLKDRSPQLREALLSEAVFSDIVINTDHKVACNVTDGAADTAISINGDIPQTNDGKLALVFREPFGPVLSIPAFNFPLLLAVRSIVYPLACGNTVIMKSSPLIPHLHNLLGPLFADAGLPPGVFQILNHADEDVAERVEQLIAASDVRMVNFTGSSSLGKIIAGHCANYLKPSVMELGGKAPAIILPSADLKLAANNLLFGAFDNSGQICMSTERVLVHSDVAEEFQSVIRETAQAAGWSGGMQLVRNGAGEGLQSLVDDAVDKGAEVIYTASPDKSSTTSTSFAPTILSSIPSSARILQEETFGPILTIQICSSNSELINLANSLETGLTSSIFSSNLEEALLVARKLESGAVHINSMTIHDQHNLPFGGWKQSGWGRFNSKGAVESFTQTKNITINLGASSENGKGLLPLKALYKGAE